MLWSHHLLSISLNGFGFASLIPAHLKEKRPVNRCLFTSTVWCPWFVCGLVGASTTLLSLFSGVICYPKPQTNSTHTHTHPFNGPFSVTTQVSRYQKGKTSLDFAEARDSEWQWHQLGHMQICISLQTDNHASTPPLKFFKGRMPFLPPNQQHQSTEGHRLIPQESQNWFVSVWF